MMDELLVKVVEHFPRSNDEDGHDIDVKSAIRHLDSLSWEYESYQNLLVINGFPRDAGQILVDEETLYFWGVDQDD